MQQVDHYDSAQRQRDKQRAREQDDRDLRSGAVSPEELSSRNGFFSSLDLSRASVRRRRRIAA